MTMRLLLVAPLVFAPVTALAQTTLPNPTVECLAGFVCLTEGQYADVRTKLTELAEIEEGTPSILFEDPVVIVTDEHNRVFTNGTGEQLIPGTLTWGPMNADLELRVDVDVRRKELPQAGFRSRPKFSMSWLVLETSGIFEDPMSLLDVGLSFDFLYYRKYNVSAYVGARSFGTGIGFDVFRNSGVLFDARWTYPFKMGETTITPPLFTPALGWYFAF